MATINGTSGNDTLSGTSGDDTINGLGGNDLFLAGSTGGNDVIDGGAGSDSIEFRERATSAVVVDFRTGSITGGSSGTISFANVERVLGGNFDDILIGNAAGQNLTGRFGADTLWGAGGVDTLWGGGDGNTFVFRETGTANADRINDFASGSDKILLDGSVMSALGASGNFAAGDDRFVFNSAGTAQDAEDRIVFNTTTKQVFYDADGSGSGAAVLIATLQSGATLVATDIVVEGGTAANRIVGTDGDDSLRGTNADDDIQGLGGNDTLNGFAGNDSLVGGDGDDLLVGEVGHDRVEGGAGADVLAHGFWDNHDTLDGGLGGDTLLLQGAASAVTVDLAAGTMLGGDSAGTATTTVLNIEFVNAGGVGRSVHMIGTSGNNFLRGGTAADRIFGGDGDDTVYSSLFAANANGDELYGGAGNDNIAAFGGNGLLDGGAGNDALSGGEGIDRFLFSVAPGESNRDHVAFFAPGTDKLVLDGTAYPEIGPSGSFSAGDDRFAAFGGSGPPGGFDPEDRVLYGAFTGELWYDPDGSGIRAAQRIATLQDKPWLEPTDIEVINGSTPPPPPPDEGEVINGTSGNDTLTGTAGNDTINGLGGNDLLLAGSTGGADVFDGGAGSDSIEFRDRATSAVVVDFGTGSISGGSSGTISFANVERVLGGNFNDILTGNAASQNLTGRHGADTLWGAGGVDTLWGGGDGNTFIFRETGTTNADRISDWTSGVDTLALDNAATGPMGALGADGDFVAGDTRFASGAGFTSGRDATDRVVFDTSTGRLYYDADGSGSGASQLIATVQTGATVAATDIVVI